MSAQRAIRRAEASARAPYARRIRELEAELEETRRRAERAEADAAHYRRQRDDLTAALQKAAGITT